MNEKHTITATLNFGDHEIDVTLKVEANYTPGWPGNRIDPPEVEGYEIWDIKLGEYPEALTDAVEQYLLNDLDGRRTARAEEAAEARREEFRERFNLPEWPDLIAKGEPA